MARGTMAARPHLVEVRGRAMGSALHIIATGDREQGASLVSWAQQRVAELEQLWSRFIPTSEVSLLNAHPGQARIVHAETVALVQCAMEARELSEGRFDPTMLAAIQANGYDRTFVSITTAVGMPALDSRRIGLGQIRVDTNANTVTLGETTGFDPGGIGKGFAADLVANEMIERGATGALVNLGGDVRCIGEGPADGGWVIAVGDAVAGVENRTVQLAAGAIASSTSRRRRWIRQADTGPEPAHHLLDPTTGHPSSTAARLVTVIAARCSDAEWIATAAAAEGSLESIGAIAGGASVMMTDRHGGYSSIGDPPRFLR